MTVRTVLVIVVLSLLSQPQWAEAGAWVQAPGRSFVKLSALTQRATERWDCRGGTEAADPDGDFVSRQLFLYGEVGLTPRLTALGSWSWKSQSVEASPSYGTRSPGDFRLGTRYGLIQGPRALAVETHLSLPTYPASDLSQPPALREQYLPAGSGRVEGEIHLLGGTSLYPWPLYANLDLGYRARSGRFGDQWLGIVEVGGGSPNFMAKTELRATLPRHEACDQGESVGAVAIQERSVQLAPEVAVRLSETLWLSVGAFQPLAGRNSLQGPVWSVGLFRWVRE